VEVGVQALSAAEARAQRKAAALLRAQEEEKRNSDMWASVRKLVKSPAFQARLTRSLFSVHHVVVCQKVLVAVGSPLASIPWLPLMFVICFNMLLVCLAGSHGCSCDE
jgi:Flp pilus assembly protein TadB